MAEVLYAEINSTCILILALVCLRMFKSMSLQQDKKLFIRGVISAIVLFGLDLLWVMMDSGWIQVSRGFNLFINVCYMFQAGLLGYNWYCYSEYQSGTAVTFGRMRAVVVALPLILLAFLSAASYWTGWLCTVDEYNQYHRGPLYLIQVVIGYGYMIFAAFRALLNALKEKNIVQRGKFMTLAIFIVAPLIGGVIQTMVPGIPMLCVGITLSLLNVFMDFQESRISLDPLTQLNNRTYLFRYLSNKTGSQNRKETLYLVMMDINAFKSINDTFGHIEGDNALLRVAGALQQTCSAHNCFAARYAGDEFIFVCEGESAQKANGLYQDFSRVLSQLNARDGAPYDLTLCMGCAAYTDPTMTIQQWIASADAELYKAKKQLRTGVTVKSG